MRSLPGATALRSGDHVCWTYSSYAEHRRVLTTSLREGLAEQQRIAYFGVDGSEERVRAYLQQNGLDVESLLGAGTLLLGDARRVYALDDRGRIDVDEMLARYRVLVDEALADGFAGVRVAAEGGWMLDDLSNLDRWSLYELRADLLAAEMPIVALCCYDARSADPVALRSVGAVHGLTLNLAVEDSTFHLHAPSSGTIAVQGDLDVEWADRASALLLGTVDELHEGVVDVSGLRFTDVAGMRALSELLAAIHRRGGRPTVRGASPAFIRLWSLLGRDDRLDVRFR